MVVTDTYTLEVGLLAAASISIALAGVAFVRLQPLGGTDANDEGRPGRRTALVRLAFRLALGTALLGSGVAAVLWALRPNWATPAELIIGFSTGVAGGVASGLWGARVAFEVLRRRSSEAAFVPRGTPRGAGLTGGVATVAGAAGIALTVLGTLFIALGGHVPALGSAMLGAGLAQLTARPTTSREEVGGRVPSSDSVAPTLTIRGDSSVETPALSLPIESAAGSLAAGVFAIFLFVGIGTSLVAFAPSVVRILVPNAVLVPFFALAVLFLTGLIGVLAAAVLFRPPESASLAGRVVPSLAAVGPTAVAALYLDGAFLATNLALLVGLFAGLVGATLLIARRSIRVDSPPVEASPGGGQPSTRSSVRPLVVPGVRATTVMIGTLTVAYIFSGWTGSGSVFSIDASLGAYGIGLAAVGLVALASANAAVRLGESFAAVIPESPESAPTPGAGGSAPTSGGEARLLDGTGIAELVGVGLGTWVILELLILLVPLQSGFSSAPLVLELRPLNPRLVAGVLIGALLLLGLHHLQSRSLGDGTDEHERGAPPLRGARSVMSRTVPSGAVAVAVPLLTGWLFGWVGLVGLLGSAAVTATALAGFWRRGRSPSHGDPSLAGVRATLLVVSAVTLVFAGWLLMRAGTG